MKDGTATVHTGDVVKFCNEYSGELFHSVVCDPPYHLTSITKRFGKKGSKPAKKGPYSRVSSGFMGKTWDGTGESGLGVAFDPTTWEAIASVMYPGAFGMAFAGTRGYHRMACAIEDAGMIIHPMIAWNFSNGFPKSTRLDTQIDEAAGLKVAHGKEFNYKGNVIYGKYAERTDVRYEAQTDLGKAWSGHRYGLQALKPAFEPICLFQKPYPSNFKPWQSIVKTGAGCLNIEETWIDGPEGYSRGNKPGQNGAFNASGGAIESSGGRWPSHLVLDESYVQWAGWNDEDTANYFVTDWMLDRMEDEDPLVYAAKASVSEREAGLDAMQRRLMVGEDDFEDLEGTINDGREAESDRPYLRNQTIRRNIHATIKPLMLTQYLAKMLLPPDLYGTAGVGYAHSQGGSSSPTELELSLGGLTNPSLNGLTDFVGRGRRLFVPFAGVGSEVIGGVLAGWERVVGVELMPDHARIAEVRLKYWSDLMAQLGPDVLSLARISLKNRKKTIEDNGPVQHELF